MANVDNPRGFIPIKHLTGAPYNGQANLYAIPAADTTATFVGDAVKHYGSADSNGVPYVIQSTAALGGSSGPGHVGVIVGFVPDPSNLSLNYRTASTLRYCYVADSPDLIFEIQEDSDGGALAATNVGHNANFVVGTGSTTSGLSAMELDSSTANTTNTLDLRILRLVRREDNEIGTNAHWEVMFNNHAYGRGPNSSVGV